MGNELKSEEESMTKMKRESLRADIRKEKTE